MKKIIQFFKDYNRWCNEELFAFRTDTKNIKYVKFDDFLWVLVEFVICLICVLFGYSL